MKDNNRARALVALLDDNNRTFSAAASAAGISRRTLYSYLREADFADAYRQQLERLAIERADALADDHRHALDTIRSIMTDSGQPGAVRLKAAHTLLCEVSAAERQVYELVMSKEKDIADRCWLGGMFG